MNVFQPYYVKNNKNVNLKRTNVLIYYPFPSLNRHYIKNSTCIITKEPIKYTISVSFWCYIKQLMQEYNDKKKFSAILDSYHPFTLLTDRTKPFITSIPSYELETFEIIEICKNSHINLNFPTLNCLYFNYSDVFHSIKKIRNYNVNDKYTFFQKSFNIESLKDISRENYNLILCFAHSDDEYSNAINSLKQLCFVICSQEQNGICFLKYGDTFSELSLDIISFMSHFYERTIIIKPNISKVHTADKYILFQNFKFNEKNKIHAYRLFFDIINCPPFNYIQRIIDCEIPLFIKSKMNEINSIYSQPRLDYIHNHFNETCCKESNTEDFQKCQEWCEKYNIHFSCKFK